MLQALPGKLTLHEADLLKKGSFDEVVKVSVAWRHTHQRCKPAVTFFCKLKVAFAVLQGVDYVFHMASPFLASWEDTQKELVEPALNGTSTVLESVGKSKSTIRRVVLTSSFAGMYTCIEGFPGFLLAVMWLLVAIFEICCQHK